MRLGAQRLGAQQRGVLRVVLDLVIFSACLLLSYWLAVQGFPFELQHGTPQLRGYLESLPVFLGVFLYTAYFFRLYRSRRVGSHGELALDIAKVTVQSALVILALLFYYRDFSYSRLILTYLFVLAPLALFGHHVAWMAWERRRHERGLGLRKCLVVGAGELAQGLLARVQAHPGSGLVIEGFIGPDETGDETGAETRDDADEAPVVPADQMLGTVDDLQDVIDARGIQEVIVALPFTAMEKLARIDQELSTSTVGLQWVPDLDAVNTIQREVTDFDGYQLINLRGVRDKGANLILKRAIDIVVSTLLLVLLSPVMAAIALVIRKRYGSPILYRQERMGLDGQVFTLFKFRTMKLDAEAESGPVWAQPGDDRVNDRFGAFLRSTSLDELPQLWNTLRGQMSLVGPRPERPVFIEEFKQTVPRYMLRHWMKAGLTGWAQVNGWRGNTSLHKRVQFDLYYLRNWTVWFDLKILVLTLLRGWGRGRNAY